jgi:hypothetical protein
VPLGFHDSTRVEMSSHPKPLARRSHKKSRAGCRNCKERKVKVLYPHFLGPSSIHNLLTIFQCDEIHPLCGKCAVHYSNLEECEWDPPPTFARDLSNEAAPGSDTRTSSRSRDTGRSGPVALSILGRPLGIKPEPAIPRAIGGLDPFATLPESRVPDLDMLIHYCKFLSSII